MSAANPNAHACSFAESSFGELGCGLSITGGFSVSVGGTCRRAFPFAFSCALSSSFAKSITIFHSHAQTQI
jgi:hypothetical protein